MTFFKFPSSAKYACLQTRHSDGGERGRGSGGFRLAGEENPTACRRQTRRLAADPAKTIRLHKGKHGIICYKSNQSCQPTPARDFGAAPKQARIFYNVKPSVCLDEGLFVPLPSSSHTANKGKRLVANHFSSWDAPWD